MLFRLSNAGIIALDLFTAPNTAINLEGWRSDPIGYSDANGFFSLAAPLSLHTNGSGYGQFAVRAPGEKFTIQTLSIQGLDNAPVPEPATWALMITGFALAGSALRRRPRQALEV